MSSIFTKIINWEIPSFKIYEDEYTFAFLDIYPVKAGHTLIVPKTEVDYFVDVPEPYYSAVFATAKKIAPAIQQATACKRVSTVVMWFDVPHFHYHLIPTDSVEDIRQSGKEASQEELQQMQEAILQYL